MKAVISWSGEKSRTIAEALFEWLPLVLPSINVWMCSSQEVEKGTKWLSELSLAFSEANVGILCLTEENIESSWIHFEAGVLLLNSKGARVVTYLCNVEPDQLKGPLSQFQAVRARKDDTLRFIQALNLSTGNQARLGDLVEAAFAIYWPSLEQRLKEISHLSSNKLVFSDRAKYLLNEPIEVIGDSVIVTGDRQNIVIREGEIIGRDVPLNGRFSAHIISGEQAYQRIGTAVKLNLNQLQMNMDQARKESNQFFKLTLIASGVGFALVLTGVALCFSGFVTAGVVSTLSSVVPEVTAALFFNKDKELRKAIESHHQHILNSQQVLTMVDIAETMRDEEERDRMKQQIIFKVLGIGNLGGSQSSIS